MGTLGDALVRAGIVSKEKAEKAEQVGRQMEVERERRKKEALLAEAKGRRECEEAEKDDRQEEIFLRRMEKA